MRTLFVLAIAAFLATPLVAADADRTVSKDYTYVPGNMTGCGAISPNEVCFPVLAGETRVTIDVVDDAGLVVPFSLLSAAPGQGNVALGTFCGATGFLVSIPAGATTVRVNFAADAITVCGSVGSTGTATATFS